MSQAHLDPYLSAETDLQKWPLTIVRYDRTAGTATRSAVEDEIPVDNSCGYWSSDSTTPRRLRGAARHVRQPYSRVEHASMRRWEVEK